MKLISYIVDCLLGPEKKEVKSDGKVYVPCNKIFGNLSKTNQKLKYDERVDDVKYTVLEIID